MSALTNTPGQAKTAPPSFAHPAASVLKHSGASADKTKPPRDVEKLKIPARFFRPEIVPYSHAGLNE
jgi:hypothetical protein